MGLHTDEYPPFSLERKTARGGRGACGSLQKPLRCLVIKVFESSAALNCTIDG